MNVMQIQLVQQEPLIIKETHPIIQCIIGNKPDELKRLLNKHDINGLYPCKEAADEVTPLIAAVLFQKEGIFSFLLRESANPNTFSHKCWTPLHYASMNTASLIFVNGLLTAKADPNNGVVINQLNLTPLHVSVINDREDVAKALISAGATVSSSPLKSPQHDDFNAKVSNMIHRLASNGFQICSKLKFFIDLDIVIGRKHPEEVFQLFDNVMLLKNPQTQLSVLDIMFSVTGPDETEYRRKGIQWLEDNHKINLYIEDAVKHLPNISKELQPLVVHSLHSVFCTLTEIPSNVSLALIPRLLELLSTNKSPNIQEQVVVTLYVIAQKVKVKDDWNLDIIEKLSSGISCCLTKNHPVAMYAYGIFASFVSTEHANRIFTSIGLTSVPKEILTSAGIMMDDNLKEGLRHLQKYLLDPSPASEDLIPADKELMAPKINMKKKKRKTKHEEQNDELHKAGGNLSTTFVQIYVGNELQAGMTTYRKQKWLKISKRWSEKLEKLSKSEDVAKVGSIMFVNDEDFRIAKGSDGTEVFLGLREDGTEMAVKRMSRSNYQLLKNEESFLRLPKLDHRFIVRYVDFAEDDNFGYLGLQLCEFTLEEFLRGDVPEEQKRTVVKDILSSLSVLHGQTPPIIHRDIKPQNILLDVCGQARLADFGISRRLPNGQTTMHTRSAGTKCWMAREILEADVDVPCKTSTDIQVAGMLTYYILSGGHHPFGKGYRCESNIVDGVYNLEHVQDVISEDLVKWMINKNPKERPTVKQCLAHPCFWSTLRKLEYLKTIGNEEEVRKYKVTEHNICLLNELDMDVGEATWRNWKEKFTLELVKKIEGKGNYSENTAGLLRFIRNLLVHDPAEAEHIDLMATFPDLFGRVYVFAKKKGWNNRVTLRKMFQEEGDITSGRAMNELNLEDQATGFSVPVQVLED